MAHEPVKRCSTLLAMRELQIKTTTKCLLTSIGMDKMNKILTILSSDKDAEKLDLSHMTARNAKWSSALEEFGFYPRETKTDVPTHKKNHMNGHHSFICNSPKLETIQMSISSGTDREVVKYPYNGTLLRSTCAQQLGSQGHVGRKEVSKGYIWSNSTYVTFWERQNYEDGEQIGCQGLDLGGRCDHKGTLWGFLGGPGG